MHSDLTGPTLYVCKPSGIKNYYTATLVSSFAMNEMEAAGADMKTSGYTSLKSDRDVVDDERHLLTTEAHLPWTKNPGFRTSKLY